MMRYLIPLVAFMVLAIFLMVGLTLNPRQVPSPLIDKPAPQFQLSQLHEPQRIMSSDDNLGKVWMLNVWASWCVSCRDEHPLLVQLAKSGVVPIYGLNYKDNNYDGVNDSYSSKFPDKYSNKNLCEYYINHQF